MQEYISIVRGLVHDGNVDFQGEVFRVNGAIQVPSGSPFPILIAALAPRMLRIAGEQAEGTVTWMVGRKTLETHIVPRISSAARAAAKTFSRYGELPSYRRMLDMEGVEGPQDVAVLGDEGEVERQLRELAGAGATDLLPMMFPVGDDEAASVARTRSLLKSLVGKM